MKVLSPFLNGFALAMAMNDGANAETWIALFFLSMVGTIAFHCLKEPE